MVGTGTEPLVKILIRKNDSISREYLIWCSNFQMYNLDCPQSKSISTHIKNHFNELLSKQNKVNIPFKK